MTKLKLNLTEGLTQVEPVKPVEDAPKIVFKQRIPAYWNILRGPKDGLIVATSDKGDSFEGTMKEFKELLRG